MVVTGDITQVDLGANKVSGLQVVRRILRDVPGIHFSELSSADVVRHRLVAEIIDAYARWDSRQH
ncbi:PhoH family protein, partial [Actinotignum timonense]|uniref:PhoH family protein n=2 Tax=Actinomycetaceae TaxID=2049 RepID=UPI00254AA7A4